MPESQKQFDFSRGAQLSALRRLRLPDGISKDGSRVRSATLLSVLRAIDDRCGKNGEQWWDQATLGKQAGISARTVSKAMQVLESMHLIEKIDTRRGGARRLVISIEWQTVFSDGEPYQDPTILAKWGLLEATGGAGFNSEVAGFNSELGSEFNSEASSELIRKPLPNSLLSKTPNYPPTLDEGEGVGGVESDFETTETGRNWDADASDYSTARGEIATASHAARAPSRMLRGLQSSGNDGRQAGADGSAVEAGEHARRDAFRPQPSTLSPEPSPMPSRTIDPRERLLIRRLVDLGVGSAVATLREALRIGYSCEAVAAILDFYQRETLTDPQTGENVPPYYTGQLVKRLRDEFASDAAPDCGKWGGRTAEWSALKLRLTGPKPEPGRVPDLSLARRAGVIESLSREQVERVLQELIARGGSLGDRAGKCLDWMETGWGSQIVPPANVTKFLMHVDVESIMRGSR